MTNVSMTSLTPPFGSASTAITNVVSHAGTTGMAPTETTTAMSEQTLMYIVIPASVIVGVPLLITAVVALVSCVCSICKRRKRLAGYSDCCCCCCCCCCEAAATRNPDDEIEKWPGEGGIKPRKANSIAPTRPLRDTRRQADDATSTVTQPRRHHAADSGAAVGAAASGTAGRRNSLTQGWDF